MGANTKLEIVTLDSPTASPASPLNEEVTAAVRKAIHELHPGIPIIPYMAPYPTDGKHMRIAGMPTYGVMGVLIREEDEFAHGLNERVQVDSFFNALEYWHNVLTDLAGVSL